MRTPNGPGLPADFLGELTVILPQPIVKFALLASATVGSVRLVMRIRASAVAVPVTTQLCIPSFGVLATIVLHDAPPLRDLHCSAFPGRSTEVQVTL